MGRLKGCLMGWEFWDGGLMIGRDWGQGRKYNGSGLDDKEE